MNQHIDDDAPDADQPRKKNTRLGSLSQAARSKELNKARSLMNWLGVLTIGFNVAWYFQHMEKVDRQLQMAQQQRRMNPAQVQAWRDAEERAALFLYGGTAVLGGVFIGLGLLVKQFPLPTTVAGLTLYVGAILFFAIRDPLTLAHYWIAKIITILGLSSAIKAAWAYQREQAARAKSARPPEAASEAGIVEAPKDVVGVDIVEQSPPPKVAAKRPRFDKPAKFHVSLVDVTVQSTRHFSIWALICLIVGLAFSVWGLVAQSAHPTILAILPFALSVTLGLIRPRPFAAHFTGDAMEIMNPPLTLPYAEILGVRARGQQEHPGKMGADQFAINVIHADGVIGIPADIDAKSRDVFRFLVNQVSPSGSREVPEMLAEHYQEQVRLHGKDQVLTYRARAELGNKFALRRASTFCLTVLATGIIWIVLGASCGPGFVGWIVGGCFALSTGFIGWAIAKAASDTSPANGIAKWKKSGVVISPDGLAMAQGDLHGELRWEEVRSLRFQSQSKSFEGGFFVHQERVICGIGLEVEAAKLIIADIYDRPLYVIYQQLQRHYHGGAE